MGVVNRGATEARAFIEKVISSFPDIQFELQSRSAHGAAGVAEWIMRGNRTVPGTETIRAVEVRGVSVFEFSGDQISRCSDYWDMAAYLKQLGIGDQGSGIRRDRG